jgi:TRAP-type mannitol/chloroaromatic compound transport system permease small subunit
MLVIADSGSFGWTVLLGRILFLIIPAGVITFAVWTVFAAVRWANRQPIGQPVRALRWVFLALLLAGIGLVISAGNGLSGERNSLSPGPQPVLKTE